MPYGLIHYNAPGDTVEEFIDFAAEAGFESAEISSGDLWPAGESEPEKRAEALRQYLADRGMVASALTSGNNFCTTDPADMDYQVERMGRVCRLAEILGTSILRADGGWHREDPRPGSAWVEAMVEGFSRSLEFAEPLGLRFALDNHGLVTNEWPVQLMVFEQVNSPVMGANLDTMNYRWFGHSVEKLHEIYQAIAPYVIHTHFKDGFDSRENYRGTALGEGEIPLEWAVQCLKQAHYAGDWTVEYEGPRDDGTGYRQGLAWLKAHT